MECIVGENFNMERGMFRGMGIFLLDMDFGGDGWRQSNATKNCGPHD